MTLDELRKAIQAKCKERGWAVMDLARATEVSPEALRRFVSARGELKPATVIRIARALGINYQR